MRINSDGTIRNDRWDLIEKISIKDALILIKHHLESNTPDDNSEIMLLDYIISSLDNGYSASDDLVEIMKRFKHPMLVSRSKNA